jgi:Pyridoxamine 5'-phosphate oxidase
MVAGSQRYGGGTRPSVPAATRTRGLTAEDVWRQIDKASFAYVAHVTPTGEPRVSGVVFKSAGHRLYIAVDPDSWKAKHIEANGRVSVVVPVRRGGILASVLPLPPATISFQARAVVHPAGPISQVKSAPKELASVVPAERKERARVIELSPDGEFLTYGLGVSLMEMLHPAIAQARVPGG